jgi:broad specificity phosphatase PhoE
MTLYLARHGRSLGEGFFLGQSDPELTDEGVRQSEELAEGLAEARIERIVCSRLLRAQQTAEIVGARIDVPVEPDARWNELRYGHWDGLAWSEIEQRWPSEAQAKLANWWTVTPEGGETRDAFSLRVKAAWDELRTIGGTVLLVGHAGGPVQWDRVTRFEQAYGDVRRIEVQ